MGRSPGGSNSRTVHGSWMAPYSGLGSPSYPPSCAWASKDCTKPLRMKAFKKPSFLAESANTGICCNPFCILVILHRVILILNLNQTESKSEIESTTLIVNTLPSFHVKQSLLSTCLPTRSLKGMNNTVESGKRSDSERFSKLTEQVALVRTVAAKWIKMEAFSRWKLWVSHCHYLGSATQEDLDCPMPHTNILLVGFYANLPMLLY